MSDQGLARSRDNMTQGSESCSSAHATTFERPPTPALLNNDGDMRRNQHPLPAKPGGGRGRPTGQNSSSNATSSNYGYANNAAGGYGGYGASGGHASNAAGGYPSYGYGTAGGYSGYGTGGYGAYAYNASGGYPYAPAAAQAWRNCAIAGCSFAGPGDQMPAHEASHASSSGPVRVGKVDWSAFAPAPAGQRSEEEEAALRRLGGGNGRAPIIQGTGISLETEEDIQKWIEERKKKFPTKERAKEKVSCALSQELRFRQRKRPKRSHEARTLGRGGRWTQRLRPRSGGGSRERLPRERKT